MTETRRTGPPTSSGGGGPPDTRRAGWHGINIKLPRPSIQILLSPQSVAIMRAGMASAARDVSDRHGAVAPSGILSILRRCTVTSRYISSFPSSSGWVTLSGPPAMPHPASRRCSSEAVVAASWAVRTPKGWGAVSGLLEVLHGVQEGLLVDLISDPLESIDGVLHRRGAAGILPDNPQARVVPLVLLRGPARGDRTQNLQQG